VSFFFVSNEHNRWRASSSRPVRVHWTRSRIRRRSEAPTHTNTRARALAYIIIIFAIVVHRGWEGYLSFAFCILGEPFRACTRSPDGRETGADARHRRRQALAHVLKTPSTGKHGHRHHHARARVLHRSARNRHAGRRRKKGVRQKKGIRAGLFALYARVARTIKSGDASRGSLYPAAYYIFTGHHCLNAYATADQCRVQDTVRYGMLFFDPRGCLRRKGVRVCVCVCASDIRSANVIRWYIRTRTHETAPHLPSRTRQMSFRRPAHAS